MGRFHSKNGWCFERLPTGSVRIDSPNSSVVLDANTWASAVASVSKEGEDRASFDAALALHGWSDEEQQHYFEQPNTDGFPLG